MICQQTLAELLLSRSVSTILSLSLHLYHPFSITYFLTPQVHLHWRKPLCCVNICNLRIYISHNHLVSCRLHHVRQQELSVEERSSRNHGASHRGFHGGCPAYQHLMRLQLCGAERGSRTPSVQVSSAFVTRAGRRMIKQPGSSKS